MTTKYLTRKNEIDRIIKLLQSESNWTLSTHQAYLEHKCGCFILYVNQGRGGLEVRRDFSYGGNSIVKFTFLEKIVLWSYIKPLVVKLTPEKVKPPTLNDLITVAENYKPQ